MTLFAKLFTAVIYSGWKPTYLTSVFSLGTSVFTSPPGTTVTAFADVADVKYGCLRMLDGLVSTHPSIYECAKQANVFVPGKPSQHNLMFSGKAKSLHKSGDN